MTYVRAKRCRRHGICDRCKTPDVPLNVIINNAGGAYYITDLCQRCYERMKWEVFHKGAQEVTEDAVD